MNAGELGSDFQQVWLWDATHMVHKEHCLAGKQMGFPHTFHILSSILITQVVGLWGFYIVHAQLFLTPAFCLLPAFDPRRGWWGRGIFRKPHEANICHDSEAEHWENPDQSKVGGKYKARTIPSRADQRSSLQGMTAENMPSMLYLNTSTLSYTHLNQELYHYYL